MEKLGIEPIQLLAQTFNFILLLIVLKKFLYKPILRMLEERQKKISSGLEYAEKMKVELDRSEKKREELIAKAKEEAREIVVKARKEAKQLEQETTAQAQSEAKNIVEKARKDAGHEYEAQVANLEKETVQLASAMVEKLLKDALSPKEQKDIIAHRLKKISQS